MAFDVLNEGERAAVNPGPPGPPGQSHGVGHGWAESKSGKQRTKPVFYLPHARLKRYLRGAVACRDLSALAQCFFCTVAEAGMTLMGAAPEGEVTGGDFLACFGFFTSRLLRI